MSKPRLLDLFCGAGGAGMGYARAGFEVVGVDIKPQPNYPFEFHCANAVEWASQRGDEFDAIHASPPCQRHCRVRHANKVQKDYPCFIDATREILTRLRLPWIIENVIGAPLRSPIQICGSVFGLKVRRHRLFESSLALFGTGCNHKRQGQPIGVYGTGGKRINRRKDDKGGACNMPSTNLAEAREAMGIDWMTRKELSQAIPPAYTEYLGKQLMAVVTASHGAAP